MSEQFNRSIIRFFRESGETKGTGFAISARHVISCTHVVAGVLGHDSDQPLQLGEELDAEMNLDGKAKIRLKVVTSLPRLSQPTANDLEDITILERVGDTVRAFSFAPLIQQAGAAHYDQPFKTYGFNKSAGDWHDGVCKGPMGAGWIQLQIDNQSADHLNGLSGAPVWNKKIQAITGMLVAKRSGEQDVYMIPAHKLAQAWPGLQAYKLATHLPEQADSAFLIQIKNNIASELDVAGVVLFRSVLKEELDKVLSRLKQPAVADNQGDEVAKGLITALKVGESDVPVITAALMNTARHCFDRRGKYYQEAQANRDAIQDAIEQILGWLVLASISDHYAESLKPSPDYPFAVYFELPVMTPGGVELLVSRCYQRPAKLESKDSNVTGCHLLHKQANQFDWQEAATVETLKLELWNQVFPDLKKPMGIHLNKGEVMKLNAELEIRRSDAWAREHHLIAIECGSLNTSISDQNAYLTLLGELDQLTLVRFGVSGQQQVFHAPEYHLMSAVSRFLNTINRIFNS